MSYRVLALKWRPQNFDSLIGQQHVVNTLKNALENNRLAHAYLFSGPRGVGKTSCARILAKALNCKNGPTVNPCNECPQCLEISQGRGLDVIEIDGASNRGIDEIRALRENVKFAPASGKYKIYIIDEVHMLTQEAFNALLKTLEEPPEYVKFIFATTQSNKVLPTILSRCQRFDFRRIPVLEIIGQLEKIIEAEGIKIDREVLAAIARSSDGALRDAETVLDQVISISGGNVSLKDVISLLGVVEQDTLFEMAEKIIKREPAGALELFNRVLDEGKEPEVFWQNLIEHYRNLMVARIAGPDAKLIDLPEDTVARLSKQSSSVSLEEIFSSFNILVEGQELLKRFDYSRIPLEVSLVMLASSAQAGKSSEPVSPGAGAHHQQAHKPAQADTRVRPPAPRPAVQHTPARPAQSAPQHRPLPPPQSRTAAPVVPERKLPEPAARQLDPVIRAATAVAEEEDEEFYGEEIAVPTAAGPDIGLIQEQWKDLIEEIGSVKMSAAAYLSEGEPLKLEKGVLTISFPKGFSLHKEALERKENSRVVDECLSKKYNARLKAHFLLSHKEKTGAVGVKAHPEVQSAIEFFGGKIVES
ncbi:MAG: DNA polymerase III subunit gamma/tau [Candidatus Omnitrophota bacterium]|jgi:DNA polymerase-3 subunit gamma/tau